MYWVSTNWLPGRVGSGKMVSGVGVAHSSSRIEDPKGDYVNLREAQAQNADDDDANNCCDDGVGDTGLVITRSRCWLVWWWARLIILLVFAGLLIAVSFKWVVPFLMNKVNMYVSCHFCLYVFCC